MSLRLAEHPAFTRYWAAQSLSVAGSMMRELTIAWLVLEETGSELWLAGAALARVGAMLLFTPWASQLADRVSRTRIILWAEAGSLFVSLLLAGSFFAELVTPAGLVTAAALLGALHAFEAPARNVLVHDLVPERALLPALSLFSASTGGARVLGPALGGLLLDRLDAGACFLVDSASYLVLLLVVLTLPRFPPAPGAEQRGLLRTLRAALAQPAARRALALLVVLSVVAGGYRPLLPAIAEELLGLGPDGLGALQACAALGALVAGIALGRAGEGLDEARVQRLTALLIGLPVLALGLSRAPLASAALIAVAAALLTAGEAAANTRLQRLAPKGERARHVGLYTILVHLYPAGGWLLALGVAVVGLGPAIAGLGGLSVLLALPLHRERGGSSPAGSGSSAASRK